MASNLIQIKASGLMYSFCSITVGKALKQCPDVNSVQADKVHGVVVVKADSREVVDAKSGVDLEVLL